jgi:hypothetical protein
MVGQCHAVAALKVKVKVRFTLEQATKSQKGLALLFL